MSANIVLLGQWNYCVFSPNPLCNHLLHPSIVSPPLDSSPLAPQQSLMSLLLYLSEPHTTPHSYSLPLCECYKKTWLKGKILWLGLPAPAPPPHTHTFLLAQQNTHTKSLKGLNYYRHAHILEHTQTKAGRHTQSLSLMATGWRWWDHQRDQKPPDNIFVQEHATIHSHTHFQPSVF